MAKYKLNQMEPAQKQRVRKVVKEKEIGEVVNVHFIDVKSKQYIGARSLRILVGKTFPDRGIVIEPIARPVFKYADKWVYWVGATPK